MTYKDFKYNFSDDFYCSKKGKFTITYTASSMSLDIETTNTIIDGQRVAWCYIWMVGIDGVVYYGRNLDELKTFLDNISNVLNTEERNIICLVHNLPFEFSFLHTYFDFTDVFARKVNKPMKAVYRNIEFRDSLVYSNLSLEVLARNYTRTQKLVGDLDYSIVRYPETELTKEELAYCENDVIILNEYFEMEIYPKYVVPHRLNATIPLTNTSKVRMEVRKEILDQKLLHKILQRMIPSDEVQEVIDLCFKGADVHANVYNVDKKLINVSSDDYTSDYIYIMLLPIFPVTPIMEIDKKDLFRYPTEKYIHYYHIYIRNLKAKHLHHIISVSHCNNMILNGKYDNGRVIEAELVELYVTHFDLEMIMKYYDGEYIFKDIYISKMGYLPKYLLKTILKYYNLKSELKDKLKQKLSPEEEDNITKLYMNSKNMLNSMYGMMCTRKGQKVEYNNGEWEVSPQKQNELGYKDFLLFQWGVSVTSYARYRLEKTILELPEKDFIYCDTDSIKYLNRYKNKHIFTEMNDIIRSNVKKSCEDNKLDFNILKGIGEWDYEGTYKEFKTLGAKRYIYTDAEGKVHSTISGIPKNSLSKIAKKRKVNVYKMFNLKGMKLSKEECPKLSAIYVDLDNWLEITPTLKVKSFCHLQESGYEMNISKDFATKIKEYIDYFGYQKGRL